MKNEELDELKRDIRREWNDGGFFLEVRRGRFDERLYARAFHTLERIEFEGRELIEREIVAWIWSIPLFFRSQMKECEARGANPRTLKKALHDLTILIEKKFSSGE